MRVLRKMHASRGVRSVAEDETTSARRPCRCVRAEAALVFFWRELHRSLA